MPADNKQPNNEKSQNLTLKNIHMEPIPVNYPRAQDLLVERADESSLKQIFDKVGW